MATTLDSLARDDVDKHLATLKRKLAGEYGADLVDRLVDEEHGRFAQARVRTFLPILIERSVRARLAMA